MFVVILIYSVRVECVFNGDKKRYTEVPHHLIPDTETEINLRVNSISAVHAGEFSAYTSLTHLNLEHNRMSDIHADALTGTQLEVLLLCCNSLPAFPNLLSIAGTLQELDVSDNGVVLSTDDIAPFTALRIYTGGFNYLSNVTAGFFINNPRLETLSLVANRIERIDEDAFTGLANLQTLDLSHNMIHVFPERLLEPLDSLTMLIFGNNP